MDYRTAYLAIMTIQMNQHLRQALLLYQMIQQDKNMSESAEANTEIKCSDPDFPNIDLSFLD